MEQQLSLNIKINEVKEEITKDNILDIIDRKIKENAPKADLYMCQVILYQFLKVMYSQNNKHDYVGYIMYGNRQNGVTTYSLDVTNIGTLKNAGILSEVIDIEYDDSFYELLMTYYSENELKNKFLKILNDNNIKYDSDNSYHLYKTIKQTNKDLLKTYEDKISNQDGTASKNRRFRKKTYFYFRFFRLSDVMKNNENILWEQLQKKYGWRNEFSLIRGI